VARYAYDPLGRRVERVTGATVTAYTYDEAAILREYRGAVVLRYVHGTGMDEPLLVEEGSEPSFYHADGLGSIVLMTNASGATTSARRYDVWGNLEFGATEQGYSFTGREWDPDAKLYYYRARYYDPGSGRFASEDPIGRAGGLNFYMYADASPAQYTDPSGLAPKMSPITVYYVCCKGGKVGVCRGPNVAAAAGDVGDCMKKHEEKHVHDFTTNRFPCDKEKCSNLPPPPPEEPILTSQKGPVECSAYCEELICLRRKFQSPQVRNRIEYVKEQINKWCQGGTVGCLP
jgi:RHS repeat-associated protein